MENRDLIERILARLEDITGRSGPSGPEGLEEAIFRRLDQTEKIIKAIQRYLPKRVTDKILLNPDGVRVEGERRPVTILFGDLSGFTAMSETMDPEQVVEVINQYFDRMVEIAERYGGHIDKFMGDALMVLFGAPVAHEDDALRACLAAIEMQEAMQQFNREQTTGINLAMSIGINSGEVVAVNVGSKSRMEYTVIGDNVNLASRLEGVAQANETVIGENTYRQVRGRVRLKKLPPVKVKGKAKPQNVYLVLGRLDVEGRVAGLRAGSVKLVGRQAEMEAIRQAIASAKAGQGRVVAITGEAGIGKSRLAKELELLARDQGFLFAKGKCYSYTTSVAYLPFIRQLNVLLEIGEKDSLDRKKEKVHEKLEAWGLDDYEPFLGSLLGLPYIEIEDLDPVKRKRKIFEGIELIFDRMASKQPLALAFEDLQWGDSLSQELLEHMVEKIEGKPILICCDYRPELALPFIARPYCLSLMLNPLDLREVHRLTAELAEVYEVSDEVLHKIMERTEGNPLFIEEVVRHLLARRLVRRQEQTLVPGKRFGRMSLPATVAGVMLGRIDSLPEEQRKVLQFAAVAGKEFDRQVLTEISKLPDDRIQNSLDSLEHFEGLLYSKQVEGRKVYEFSSTTTYEVAYGTLLKTRRRELHGKVGLTLEKAYRENLEPYLEDLAHHFYNSAFDDKAVHYLHKAGDKARGLYANKESLGYYERAERVLKHPKMTGEQIQVLAEIIFKMGGILRLIGDTSKALAKFNTAAALAKKARNHTAQDRYVLEAAIVYDMQGKIDKAVAILDLTIVNSKRRSDDVIQARALTNRAHIFLRTGELEKAVALLEQAKVLFEKHREIRQMTKIYGSLGQVKEMMGDIPGAVEQYQAALNTAQQERYLEVVALAHNHLGNCYMMMGDQGNALRSFQAALDMAVKIGDLRTESFASGNIGILHAMNGEYDRALASFTSSLKAAQQTGEIVQQKNMYDNIGTVCQIRGELVEAIMNHRQAVAIGENIGDISGLVEPLRNLGLDLALNGNYTEALDALRIASEYAVRIGDPRSMAFVKGSIGAIAVGLGDIGRATEELDAAMELAKQVGDPELLLFIARNLTELEMAAGDLAAAAGLAEKGIRLSQESNNRRELAYALANMGTILADREEWEALPETLAESLEIAHAIGDRVLLFRLYLISTRKAIEARAYKEAEHFLDDALEIGQQVGSPDLLWQVHYRRGELLRAQGLDHQAAASFAAAREAIEAIKPKVPAGMWDGLINNTERKLVYRTLG